MEPSCKVNMNSVSPWGRARTQDLRDEVEDFDFSVSPWGRARTQDNHLLFDSQEGSVSPWGRARTQDFNELASALA